MLVQGTRLKDVHQVEGSPEIPVEANFFCISAIRGPPTGRFPRFDQLANQSPNQPSEPLSR